MTGIADRHWSPSTTGTNWSASTARPSSRGMLMVHTRRLTRRKASRSREASSCRREKAGYSSCSSGPAIWLKGSRMTL